MGIIDSIDDILKALNIKERGRYENHFYIIPLKDSDDYARMFTNLEKHAINTEFPNFGKNKDNTTVKATNYFELDLDNITYTIFLIADFDNDEYYVKIREKQ